MKGLGVLETMEVVGMAISGVDISGPGVVLSPWLFNLGNGEEVDIWNKLWQASFSLWSSLDARTPACLVEGHDIDGPMTPVRI